MRRFFPVVLSLLLAALLLWWWSPARKNSPASGSTSGAPTQANSSAPAVSPENALRKTPVILTDIPTAPLSRNEIARVVADNAAPGRILFVDLAFSAGGIRAMRATGAAGRAKPSPTQHGPGQLQYEVFSPSGERTLTGSIADPLHERLEYEDEHQPGALRTTLIEHNEGLLNLRLPGEADAARVVFYREASSPSTREVVREPAGEIVLR